MRPPPEPSPDAEPAHQRRCGWEPGSVRRVAPSASPAPSSTPAPTAPTPEPTATPGATPGPTIGPGATVPPYAPGNIGLLWEALKLAQDEFVRRGDLDPNQLTYGMIAGLVQALGDPGHTVFLTPDQAKSEAESLDGKVVGIGIYLGQESGTPVIVSVMDRSPAERAGLRSGDAIIEIDGDAAEALTLEEIARAHPRRGRLDRRPDRDPPGTNVPVDVTVTRERLEVPAVTWTMIPAPPSPICGSASSRPGPARSSGRRSARLDRPAQPG